MYLTLVQEIVTQTCMASNNNVQKNHKWQEQETVTKGALREMEMPVSTTRKAFHKKHWVLQPGKGPSPHHYPRELNTLCHNG